MSREIKFRAWDNENDSWCVAEALWTNGKGVINYANIPLDEDDDITVEQYTGLKDKKGKGKESYHHDIIEICVGAPWDDEVLITVRGEIIWQDAMWWFQDFNNGEWTGPLSSLGNFEIKGNRHQNPNLLKGDRDERKDPEGSEGETGETKTETEERKEQ